MKNISLRMRLTLYIVLLLTGLCALLTALSMYNADRSFVVPNLVNEAGENEQEELFSQTPDGAYKIELIPEDADPAGDDDLAVLLLDAQTSFKTVSICIMIAVIIGGGILTYFILGRALKPLGRLSTEIENMTENGLSQPIGGFQTNDEVGCLAASFNQMLKRLDKAFSDQKRFSSDAAHELKTPLAAIKTNIDVLHLDDHPANEDYEKTIQVVEKQTGRMIKLVDNLFTMTAQRSYDFNDTVDFDRMFDNILSELMPRIREKKLSVTVQPMGIKTTANSVMLTRAFSNLVENAVKYNVDGGKIQVCANTDGKQYTISISDTGIGIPQEKLDDIFAPFYRIDKSRSKTEGAGLGLSIASEIIHRHGGTITAAVEHGKTVFFVTLPVIFTGS